MQSNMKGYTNIHDPQFPAFSTRKRNSKFEIILVKLFSQKQKTNQILPATMRKINFVSSRKQRHVPLDYDFSFCVNVEISNQTFR